jgi:hypothetical protein
MADVDLDWSLGQFAASEVALVANTAKTVGFNRDLSAVEVANFGGSATVYVAFVDTATQSKAATVAGKHCYPVYPNSVATLPVRSEGNTLVSLISSGATTVWVNAT